MLVKLVTILTGGAWVGVAANQAANVTFRFQIDESTVYGCGTFTVNFTHGKPPYRLTAIPSNNDVYHWEYVPYTETPYGGTAELDLPYATDGWKDPRIIFFMSDSTGYGAGGVSGIINVQESNYSCTPPDNNFYWAANPPVVDEFAACEDITILWGKQHGMKNEPKGQVTFVGVIPNGDLWIPDDDFYDEVGQILNTTLPISEGTTVLYAAWDERGSGGTVSPATVKGGSSRCLNADSPSTTASISWSEITASAVAANNASATPTPPITNNNHTTNEPVLSTGVKVGIAVGIVVACALLLLCAFFLWRRSRNVKPRYGGPIDMIADDDDESSDLVREVDDPSAYPTPFLTPPTSDANPRLSETQSLLTDLSRTSLYPPGQRLAPHAGPATVGIGALPVKGGAFPPAREPTFVHHEDAGSAEPTPDPDTGVIDVPPEYNPAWSDAGGSSSTTPLLQR